MTPQNLWMKAYRFRWIALGIVVIWLVFMLFGCSLVPTERASTLNQAQRETVVGKDTTNITRATETTPANLTITTKEKGGTEVKIEQPVQQKASAGVATNGSESSHSEAEGSSEWSIKIPLFAKIIGMVVGISMLIALVWFIWKAVTKTKVGQALSGLAKVADDYLSRSIDHVRSLAQTETDPAKASTLNGIVAHMEKQRAEFNKD